MRTFKGEVLVGAHAAQQLKNDEVEKGRKYLL